ncbi:GtrA family protein [Pseudomonas sp. FP597]|uniref:GtrA family protein n=1 Tax=Pseudomonas sp. FP597 TaxID=2954096 RepID=UPI002735BA8D|nr:GtrA family protein [Pseudomonas sp. FP597]WLI07916.1 GtrA family protein [Pseudomonas sp. FP597]
MSRLWKGFSSYTVVGVANTVIHWQLFFVFRAAFELSQAVSNLLVFCIAASFSFYVNALYTFSVPISVPRYALFMLCMVSLVCGFLLSRWVVFREPRQ